MMVSIRHAFLCFIFLVTSTVFFTTGAVAQNYPNRPVRVIAPYSPGGSVDMVARLVAQKLSDALGEPFVVENRAGASGNIGANFVAKSAPDGYTLLMSASPPLAANVHLFASLPFDPVKDFSPVILVATQPNALVVHPSVRARSVKELIELAKASPGKLTFGSAGVGASQHMAAEQFMMMTGVKMTHIPYKGGAPAMLDLVGGRIDLMFETVPSAMSFVKSGDIKPLAVTSMKRVAALPDVPSIDEAGVKGYEFRGWIGLTAPAGTPRPIIEKLNAAVREALRGDLSNKLTGQLGLDVAGGSPEDFAAFIRADSANYGKLTKAAKIVPQ